MDICIRADGGSTIGMGHIVRMLTLANKLKINNNVFFVCRVDKPLTNKYIPGINLIKENGFIVKEIEENRLKQDIKFIEADCIITDSYDIDVEYFNIIKENFKLSGCLDDENICSYYNVDFLINQNIYGNELEYTVNEDTKMFLGSKFVILRDEFRTKKKQKYISKIIKDIMITVGGSDNNNITQKLIDNLKRDKYILHVVIGSGFNNIELLKGYECENIKLYMNANMKKLMDLADICISSCGTTIYELASCGTPTIGIPIIDNQELLAKTMNKKDLIKVASIDNINNVIKSLTYEERLKLSEKCSNLIDGLGVDRLVKEINNMF
ncbi:UDP-2,4-diacetamido-2,4,6-trideoxy-beta-L-altropyranose hydrolase [Clostridium fallax]|uniref:UDP-2,4-diacetamido-2,4,6-trideoxy-beta-L-altropyranose hydrolase n=1 Tax=Clostridium fallax TaxID=1533 RepID=A0A1M4UKN1_9CLOT|nr:UDP-2,4-diacetamido-2,4,6-trideoxy-beta-L-altropyranose hydrolase [Clostridium fallax]SHE57259.1 UDP-2,4-diacetamido-2,4,6-trideoxy-beta-L-altropyranose hydrolase [Clostridium fallax]SQB07618.1 glycosyltransferase [Clostridium fallax]